MARFSQVHQIRGKIWGVLLLQEAKIGKESQFWGHLRLYLKFKGQNLGLRHEFQRQNLGPSPSRPPYKKWPLRGTIPFTLVEIMDFVKKLRA